MPRFLRGMSGLIPNSIPYLETGTKCLIDRRGLEINWPDIKMDDGNVSGRFGFGTSTYIDRGVT